MAARQIVLRFSLFGILAGILNVLGWIGGMEWIFWLALVLFSGIYVSRNLKEAFFWPSIALGLLWGITTAGVQGVLYDTFLENNPNFVDSFNEISDYIEPRLYLLISNSVRGLITGLLVFLAALLFRKTKT